MEMIKSVFGDYEVKVVDTFGEGTPMSAENFEVATGYRPTVVEPEEDVSRETPEEAPAGDENPYPNLRTVVNGKGYTRVFRGTDKVASVIYGKRKNGVHVGINDKCFQDERFGDIERWGWEFHPAWNPCYATVMSWEKLAILLLELDRSVVCEDPDAEDEDAENVSRETSEAPAEEAAEA